MKNKLDRIDYVLNTIGMIIHNECKNYAIERLDVNDYVSLRDTGGKQVEEIAVRMGDEKVFSTIKKSSTDKYITLYDNKFQKIISKLLK